MNESYTLTKEKKKKGEINAKSFFLENGVVFAFFLLLIIFSIWSDAFFSQNNIFLVLRQVAVVGVIGCGMTVVLISGNIDLSVGATVSLTAYLMVDIFNKIGPTQAVLTVFLVGLLIGLVNGFLVGILKLNALIVTLGTKAILEAITLIYSQGYVINIRNPDEQAFAFLGRGMIAGVIPFPVIVFLLVVIFFYILLTKTKFGMYCFAMGGNEKAVTFSGIRTTVISFAVMIITALAASLGGIMLASRNMAAQTTVGAGMEFRVLAAVVLGGTSMLGGSGSVLKTVIGVLLLGFLYNAFILVGLPYYSTQIVEWVVIILAVWLDIVGKKDKS